MSRLILIFISLGFLLNGYGQAGNPDLFFGGKGWVKTDFSLFNMLPEKGEDVLVLSDGSMLLAFQGPGLILSRHYNDGSVVKGFGIDGYSQPVPMSNAQLALQDDGRIVAGGVNYGEFVVARYHPNGTLDNTFGADGKVTTAVGSSTNYPASMAIQNDGKILMAGTNGDDFVIVRYNPDGSLDSAFDGDGKLFTSIGNSTARATSVVIQSDGKILVAGTSVVVPPYSDFAVVRFTTDGRLDSSFGGDGIVTTDIGSGTQDLLTSVAIQSDGKIVVAGSSEIPGTGNFAGDFAVVRYNAEGTLDNSFGGGDGKLTTHQGRAYSVAIQSDGKIVVAGWGYIGASVFVGAVMRHNSNGSLDSTFDGDGYLHMPGTANSVALQNDGKIVCTGAVAVPPYGNTDFILMRFNIDGSFDASFSGDGQVTGYYPSGRTEYNCIATQSDGKILVGGRTFVPPDNYDFALARYNPDGSLDNTFSDDGRVTHEIEYYDDAINSIAIQADGKIVAAGKANMWREGTTRFVLTRYHSNGFLDRGFGNYGNGIITAVIENFYGYASSVAIQKDGKIVVAGSDFGSGLVLLRYKTDGKLDNTFDGDGKVITPLPSYTDGNLALQSDGKILMASSNFNGNNHDFVLVRYNTDGSLDLAFDGDGIATTDFDNSYDFAKSIAIQSDGKILVGGSSASGFALSRYNPDGSLDSSFDGDGKLTTAVGTLSSIAIQNDGKIIAAGSNNGEIVLVRYNSDGTRDSTFSGDGKVSSSLGVNAFYRAVAILKNDIYIAGDIQDLTESGLLAAYLLDVVKISCPNNHTVSTNAGTCTAVVNGMAPVFTPDGANAVVNYTLAGASTGSGTGTVNGRSFNKGVTSVLYKLRDDTTQSCSFSVTVTDSESPKLHSTAEVSRCFSSNGNYTIDSLEATDNCGISSLVYNITGATTRSGNGRNPSGTFNPGTSVVTWTAKDEQGNTATSQTTVIVNPELIVSMPFRNSFSIGVPSITIYSGVLPGSSILLTVNASGGDSKYTYLWSTGATTRVIRISPTVSTTYRINVTDGQGCTKTTSVEVKVKNMTYGQGPHRIQIVPSQQIYPRLSRGESSGNLAETAEAISITAFPNPSTYSFRLLINRSDVRPLDIRVMDAKGRVIETISNITGNLLELGHQYRPGFYYVEVMNEKNIQKVKLIKSSR